MSPYTQQFLDAAGYASLTSGGDIRTILAGLVQFALSFVGVIFFVLIIYGGFLWMSASGNEEQVTKAQAIIKSAVIGLVITLLSYMIVRAVASFLYEATGPTNTF